MRWFLRTNSAPVPGPRLTEAFRAAYGDALDLVLLLGVGIAVFGTLVVLVLVRPPRSAAGPCGHLEGARDGADLVVVRLPEHGAERTHCACMMKDARPTV